MDFETSRKLQLIIVAITCEYYILQSIVKIYLPPQPIDKVSLQKFREENSPLITRFVEFSMTRKFNVIVVVFFAVFLIFDLLLLRSLLIH